MTIKHTLQQTWRSFLILKKKRSEPLWVRLLVGSMLVTGVALVLMLCSIFLMAMPERIWWSSAMVNNLLLGLGVGAVMLLTLRAVELLLPAAAIDALAAMQDWRPIAVVSAVLFAGTALGVRLAYVVLSSMYDFDMWKKLSGVPMVQLKFLIFALLIVAANWVWWLLRAKEKALAQQAAESQLRMLQAQIEPHFLFNTLANVQSLIASDAPRAQLMLASFTDYLRASLGQMRVTDSTLDVELETARNYLQLMQIRMGSRLRFSIDACEQARQAVMPPLLLQPLVENAVHHGLEPKVEGGSVRLCATIHQGKLEIRIDDDGLGLQHARRPVRPGSGMALANINTRLQTRYGGQATLDLAPLDAGTRATLTLPLTAVRVAGSAQNVRHPAHSAH
ncbi:MAG: histidine kinase [Pseudomonadota bacterium]